MNNCLRPRKFALALSGREGIYILNTTWAVNAEGIVTFKNVGSCPPSEYPHTSPDIKNPYRLMKEVMDRVNGLTKQSFLNPDGGNSDGSIDLAYSTDLHAGSGKTDPSSSDNPNLGAETTATFPVADGTSSWAEPAAPSLDNLAFSGLGNGGGISFGNKPKVRRSIRRKWVGNVLGSYQDRRN